MQSVALGIIMFFDYLDNGRRRCNEFVSLLSIRKLGFIKVVVFIG
jgi:hypothetical protein